MIFNHGNYGNRLAGSSPDTCAEDERSESEGSRAERKAFERTSRNAAKWTQGTAKGLRKLPLDKATTRIPLYRCFFEPCRTGRNV